MKNHLFLLPLAAVLTLTSCKKECPEYHKENGNDCVAFSTLFAGTWHGTGNPTCSNGSPFVNTIVLTEGPAANTVGISDGLFLVATDANHAEGGPWPLADTQGQYMLNVEVVRTDAVYQNTVNSSGIVIGQTLVQPELISYTITRNRGQNDQIICSGFYEK